MPPKTDPSLAAARDHDVLMTTLSALRSELGAMRSGMDSLRSQFAELALEVASARSSQRLGGLEARVRDLELAQARTGAIAGVLGGVAGALLSALLSWATHH